MNNIAIMGRMTKDPELRTSQNGTEVARFTVAVDFYNGKEKVADFFPVVTFGKTAANVCRFLSKGSSVGVIGEIHCERYKDKNGVDRQNWTITASKVDFISGSSAKKENDAPEAKTANNDNFAAEIDDDDFPF